MSHTFKFPERVKSTFRFSTLSFIFIIAYVNIFQYLFGPENSIVGVIFTIMMSASMARDLTAEPLKHLCIQALVLVGMALAAFFVTALPALPSFLINFVTLLVILYSYTYEYSNHLYFPYILSYLFLVFLSPIQAEQLPGRLLGMLAGAVSIILYQWFMGRKRVEETARDVLSEMIDEICRAVSCRLCGDTELPKTADMRQKLCLLSRTVYERRKKVLCVSDASFSMIDAGRGLEHLLILITELPEPLSERERTLLLAVSEQLGQFRAFLQQESDDIPLPASFDLNSETVSDSRIFELFGHSLLYIRDRLLHMTDPDNRIRYRKTALSMKVRLQAALDISPVRVIYAVRTALLLSAATLLVQTLALPHGKWLLFTLASVSLPYADDVPLKMKKRILATLAGGLASLAIYSLIPSAAGRTAAMMLSGYVSFYFTDYTQTFACSTVGALGGAVFMSAFGFRAVGSVFFIRLMYVLVGAAVAYMANCWLFPYSRARATERLLKKYAALLDLLTKVCRYEQLDPQLYFNLIIQAHLQEEKLTQNASLEQWEEFPSFLAKCRERVRQAHRSTIAERKDAPIFKPGHLS